MKQAILFGMLVSAQVAFAGEPGAPTAGPTVVDLKALPANQWVERPLAGWPGKIWYGPGIHMGLCSAGPLGMLVFDGALLSRDGHIQDSTNARIRKLDLATGAWSELAAAPLEIAFRDKFNNGIVEKLHGTQLAFDPDRQVLVGLTTTDLDGRGRTVEFDLRTRQVAGFKPDPSPPVVTAASLAYDPVNKEMVLATGGFSPIGGTDGTWLYDGSKKQWRRLETPKEVDEVRLPLEAAQDRLDTLRWLVWKNLEFRATEREKLLDERSRGEALAREAAALATELKKLGALAGVNSAKAGRPYHKSGLAAAVKLLADAAAKLDGSEERLKTGSPEELEALYRGNLVPALEAVGKAVSELQVTPEPRMSARLVFDPKNQVIVCFGGDAQCGVWGDTWVYHCGGRWWERRRPASRPPPMEARSLAFDPGSGLIVLMQSSRWGGKNERLYIYDTGTNEWRSLDIARPGDAFWLEHDAAAGCLVALNHDMNKAWLLRLDPTGAKAVEGQSGPDVRLTPNEGVLALRDAATVADLRRWKAAMDEWVRTVPPNTWVPAPTNGTGRPNGGRTWSSIVLDPDRHQVYYRDGGHGSYHGADTDHYDVPTGRWFRSGRHFMPPWPMGTYFAWGRSFSLAPWAVHTYKYGLFLNPLRQRLQRSIGQSGRMEGAAADSVLEYDPDTGRWARDFVPLGAGTGGAFGGGVTVPGVPNGMLSINNFTRYGQKDGEATYLTKDGARQWKNLGNLPRTHNDHCFSWFFDSKRNRALYYGGAKGKHELFALDLNAESPKWEKLEIKGAGDGKLPLSHREVVYVPKHDVFLMIAASETPYAKGQFETIWKLNPADNTFARVDLAGSSPPNGGVSNGLQYEPMTDLCYYIAAGSGSPPLCAFRYEPDKK